MSTVTVISCTLCSLGHSLEFLDMAVRLICMLVEKGKAQPTLWNHLRHVDPNSNQKGEKKSIILIHNLNLSKSVSNVGHCLIPNLLHMLPLPLLYMRPLSLSCTDTWLHTSQHVPWLGRERTKQFEACGAHCTDQQRVSVQGQTSH